MNYTKARRMGYNDNTNYSLIKENMNKQRKRNITIYLCGIITILIIIFIIFDNVPVTNYASKIDTTPTVLAHDVNTAFALIKIAEQRNIDVYNANYNACLLQIMWSEGLVLKETPCPAGQLTIGFGHNLADGHNKIQQFNNFNYRNAFELLQVDFCKCIDEAIRLGFDKENNEQLAVAHIIYGLGSTAEEIVKDTMLTELHKYVWYSKIVGDESVPVKSENLAINRKFEHDLYFSNDFINFNLYIE